MALRVGIIGAGKRGAARAEACVDREGVDLVGVLDVFKEKAYLLAERCHTRAFTSFNRMLQEIDVLSIAIPTRDHFVVAQNAVKQGVHIFLEWPPTTSVRECKTLLESAEEADVQIGVSRPLRFHPLLATGGDAVLPTLVDIQRAGLERTQTWHWPHQFAETIDLCCTLAQSQNIKRIEGTAVRGEAAIMEAVAFNLRFHQGTYAHVTLKRMAAHPRYEVYCATSHQEIHVDLFQHEQQRRPFGETKSALAPYVTTQKPTLSPNLLEAVEWHAFLDALNQRRPIPVPLLDGLHTLRLVERLMEKLR